MNALFRQYFQYGFWKVLVIQKHRVPGSARHVTPALFVAGNILLILTILANQFVKTDTLSWVTAGGYLINAFYVLFAFVASFLAAKRDGWKLMPVLPLVFVVYHLSYGIGFLAGLSLLVRPGQGMGGLRSEA